MRLQKRYGWAHWLQWFQSDLHTVSKSGSSPDGNSYNRVQGTEPLAVAFEALFRLEKEFNSSYLSRLS